MTDDVHGPTSGGGVARAAARGVAWSAAERWGAKLVATGVLVLLARELEPADFGLVALAMVFVTFVEIGLEQGFGSALVQRTELERGHLHAIFWTGLCIGLALTVVTLVVAGPVADLLDQPDLAGVLRWLSLSFLLVGAGTTPQALLRRTLDFRALAARRVVAVGLSGVVAVALALAGAGVGALVAQRLVLYATMAVVVWVATDYRPGLAFAYRHVRELVGFSAATTGMRLLFVSTRKMDDLLVGVVLGPVALGYYDVAYRLLLVLSDLFTGTVATVGLPVFSRLQHDLARLRRAVLAAVRLTALLTFPAFAGFAVLAPDLIPTVFGAQWEPSVPVAQVLAVGGAMHALSYYHPAVLTAVGRPSFGLLLAVTSAVVGLAGFAIAVNVGLVAVAAAYALREYLVLPLPLLQLRRLIGLDVGAYLRQLAVPLAATLAMVGVVLLVLRPLHDAAPVGRLAVGALVGAVTYLGILAVADRPLLAEAWHHARGVLPARLASVGHRRDR